MALSAALAQNPLLGDRNRSPRRTHRGDLNGERIASPLSLQVAVPRVLRRSSWATGPVRRRNPRNSLSSENQVPYRRRPHRWGSTEAGREESPRETCCLRGKKLIPRSSPAARPDLLAGASGRETWNRCNELGSPSAAPVDGRLRLSTFLPSLMAKPPPTPSPAPPVPSRPGR